MRKFLKSSLLTAVSLFIALPSLAQTGERDGGEHWKKQHAENVAFRETLKGKDPGEILAAVKAHRDTQFKENLIFLAGQKEKRAANINGKERLSDDQKAELISFLEVMHAKRISFYTAIHQDTINLLDKLTADADLTPKDIRGSLKKHHEAVKSKMEKFRQEQRTGWHAKLKEVLGPRHQNRREVKAK